MASPLAEAATRQLTNADLAQGAARTEDARFATIVVTRTTKEATTRDEFNVPVERREEDRRFGAESQAAGPWINPDKTQDAQ